VIEAMRKIVAHGPRRDGAFASVRVARRNWVTRAAVQPRPTKGIAVAMMVMNWTLASSGRPPWDDRVGDVLHVHRRLDRERAVGLRHALLHPLGHLGGGVADVDLAAGDVEGAAVERGRLGQPVIACLVAV
jgi:hypothetical protein